MRILLDEFKAAPIPASETDWQDLQRRLNSPQRTQKTQRRTQKIGAKAAIAVCAVLLIIAARRLPLPPSRTAPTQAPPLTKISSSSAPPSSNSMTPEANTVTPGTKIAPQSTKTAAQNTKSITRNTKATPRNATAKPKAARVRLAARTRYRRFAKHKFKVKTPQEVALKLNAPNPEANRIAFDADAENVIFLVLPLEMALSPAPNAAADAAPQMYVTAAIPAAPPPGTIENEPKEMQAW